MDGRALSQFLKKGKKAKVTAKKKVISTEAKYDWGTYKLKLEMSVLGDYKYFDFTKTERESANK